MINFDLLSDLHINSWKKDQDINFEGLGTSLYCVVAGDISRNLAQTKDFLYNLSNHYSQILFIDGNHEHKQSPYIETNLYWLSKELSKKKNITFLHDSAYVINNTAFVGINGWWSFDFMSPDISRNEHIDAYCLSENASYQEAEVILNTAIEQSNMLCEHVAYLNTIDDIDEIVVVTHTCPKKELLADIQVNDYDIGTLSKLTNSMMDNVLFADTFGKITTWCFGHFHGHCIDKVIDDIRYVSHPRGNPKNKLHAVYYPKLINL